MSTQRTEKLYFISLGCDKNRIDAEKMCYLLEEAGYGITADLGEADAAIINTCGFIESSKVEALDNIYDMVNAKNDGVIRAIIVTGCLSERHGLEMMELIPEVDAVVGIGQNPDIVGIVDRALRGESHDYRRSPLALDMEGERLISTPQHYAFLKIAEGCDNHCTFCAIPGIRGRYRSRSAKRILEEARKLVSYGVREIILVAQDTTSYGKDLENGDTLASLLRSMSSIEGLWKIRILYAYPEHITDELLEEMASNDRICRYLDIPLQHANDQVLRRMGRFGSGKENLELIKKIKRTVPGITLRSTFIVGFPGETDGDFEGTLAMLRRARFDMIFSFIYSPRKGTPAAEMKEQVSTEAQHERFDRMLALQNEIGYEKNQALLGVPMRVLCDGPSKSNPDLMSGRTEGNKIAFFRGEPDDAGKFITFRADRADAFAFYGEKI